MGYEAALKKAWECVKKISAEEFCEVRFLNKVFAVKLNDETIIDKTDGKKAKDFISILILHYLEKKLLGLPAITGKWISFKELPGGQSYYSAFRKSTIDNLIEKFEKNPAVFNSLHNKFPCIRQSRSVKYGDNGAIVDVFEEVPLLITVWKGDDEFSPDANILFDENIVRIFCTEDVSVLSGILVREICKL